MGLSIHRHISLFCQLRVLSAETLEARNTPGAQNLDSGAIIQEKEPAILGDMPKTGTGDRGD